MISTSSRTEYFAVPFAPLKDAARTVFSSSSAARSAAFIFPGSRIAPAQSLIRLRAAFIIGSASIPGASLSAREEYALPAVSAIAENSSSGHGSPPLTDIYSAARSAPTCPALRADPPGLLTP